MIITSHMQKIIQIYPCLLKLSRKQDYILHRYLGGMQMLGRVWPQM
jgi:hypothetical protein